MLSVCVPLVRCVCALLLVRSAFNLRLRPLRSEAALRAFGILRSGLRSASRVLRSVPSGFVFGALVEYLTEGSVGCGALRPHAFTWAPGAASPPSCASGHGRGLGSVGDAGDLPLRRAINCFRCPRWVDDPDAGDYVGVFPYYGGGLRMAAHPGFGFVCLCCFAGSPQPTPT